MAAHIIDGKAIAAEVLDELRSDVAKLTAVGVQPCLATVLVGEDAGSQIYVRNKHRKAKELGLRSVREDLPESISEQDLCEIVTRLNADPDIDGVLVQLPLPKHIDERRVLDLIDPAKDVDGLLPANLGQLMVGQPRLVACTPAGCLRLLDSVAVDLVGARALVIGRSNIVGKPMAQLLLNRHATVTICHSRSRELAQEVARADVVVAAVGQPGMVKGAWLKPGCVVIDVGTSRGEDGKLCGDVEFSAACERAAFITPVPGGVGPMTIAMLMVNTVRAARLRRGLCE